MPPDLDAAFRKFIPPFGAAGNPVDITGGEPPITYRTRSSSGLEDDAHPRADPRLLAHDRHAADGVRQQHGRGVEEMKAKGIVKPIVASLAGDVEVEEAAEYPLPARHPGLCRTRPKSPVEVLGAKYKWARGAGLL